MSYCTAILPCYPSCQGERVISLEATNVILYGHIALLPFLSGRTRHIIRGYKCHIVRPYCPATLPVRANASYHKRLHMSYCTAILPCHPSWQGRCVILLEATNVILYGHIALLPFLSGRTRHIIRVNSSYHKRLHMSYCTAILPCHPSWQGRCVILLEATNVILYGHIALLPFLSGRTRHIIRGYKCHIVRQYCPATLPVRANASYHKRIQMSYCTAIFPCYPSCQGRRIIS